MRIYDIFQETELKAHLAIPQEGPPTWDYSPDAWGGQWMDDALREGIVATITHAPCEEAWYYGELIIQPHRPEMEGEGRRQGLGGGGVPSALAGIETTGTGTGLQRRRLVDARV